MKAVLQVYFHINLDKKVFDLGIDGVYAGTYKLASNREISLFRYGVTKEGVMEITADYAVLTHTDYDIVKNRVEGEYEFNLDMYGAVQSMSPRF